jgi:Carboxypeptidase regulatory-like domain
MHFSRKLTHAVVALSCIGMVVPQVAFAAPQAAVVTAKPRDVALNTTGHLTGAVLNAQAKPVDGAKVVLSRNGTAVAEAISKKDGTFTLPQVKSGSYDISVGEAQAKIRVWTSEAAPANAARKMALAAEGVIRAQNDGEVYFEDQGGFVGGLDIITLTVITGVVAAVVLSAVNNQRLNDINDKLDNLVSP